MPRHSLHITERADLDLAEIHLYSELEWGLEQTDVYSEGLFSAMRMLLTYPESGLKREDLGDELRSVFAQQHVIVYKMSADLVDIVRVFHEREDPTDIL